MMHSYTLLPYSSNNTSFNAPSLTHSRPQSSNPKRRTSKSLLPLDPKIYRIVHHSNKRPPIGKQKKKRLIPLSKTPTEVFTDDQKTTINDIEESNYDKPLMIPATKKKRPSPKFISMRTFNLVKKTWTRKDDDKVAKAEMNKRKKRRVTESNSRSKSKSYSQKTNSNSKEKPKSHFSDISGMSKRNNNKKGSNARLRPLSNHKGNIVKKPIGNMHSSNSTKHRIELPHVAVTNTEGNQKKKVPIVISTGIDNSNKANGTSPNAKQQQRKISKEGDKEKTIRKINTSFTFGKEPNSSANTPPLNNNKQQPNSNLPTINNNKSPKSQGTFNPKVIHPSTNQPQAQTIHNLQPNFRPSSPLSTSFNQETLQSISNVNKLSINSVISKNILLNSQLQESLNSLIDNTQCVYCLKRVTHPITLQCTHELCISCAEELLSLSAFTKLSYNHTSPLQLKCPKCHKKTIIPPSSSLEALKRLNWKPIDLTKGDHPNEKLQICEICPNSKYFRDIAEFECLNCDILICYDCRTRHLRNDRHELHKIIQYHKIIQEKVELTLCEKHREPLKLFCMKDLRPICVICANYESGEESHKDHEIKTVKHVLDDQSIQLAAVIREREGQIRVIEELMSHMSYAVEKLQEEKTGFFERINKVYDEIYDMIKKHEINLKQSVNKVFDDKLINLKSKLHNFTLIKMRYDYYRNLICEKDIDIIQRVNLLTQLNKRIGKVEQLALLKVSNLNDSLANSQVINPSIKDITIAMNQYKFLPITKVNIEIFSKLFAESTIIHKEMILTDLVVLLPKIKTGVLLYQVSKDGASAKTFHERCNNKGPTITIVKTGDGFVFGGFSNISWICEEMYNESEESYLFRLGNLSRKEEWKGCKCPVKRYMKHHAIRQTKEMFSPVFGELDSPDLFISYVNLKNSYSNLGKVYKVPKGCDPTTFFAGKPNNWDIVDVEVYAVEVIDEQEYYRIVLA